MNSFKVNIHSVNDGKQKSQSEELHVQVDLHDCETDTYGDLRFVTYGANKEEVAVNIHKFMDKLLLEVIGNIYEHSHLLLKDK